MKFSDESFWLSRFGNGSKNMIITTGCKKARKKAPRNIPVTRDKGLQGLKILAKPCKPVKEAVKPVKETVKEGVKPSFYKEKTSNRVVTRFEVIKVGGLTFMTMD